MKHFSVVALKVFAIFKIRQYGDSWKAQWLKAPTVLPGVLFHFTASTSDSSQLPLTPFQRIWLLPASAHVWCT